MSKLNDDQIAEIEVLAKKGVTGKKIAEHLKISPGTAHKYMRNIKKKSDTLKKEYQECKLTKQLKFAEDQIQAQEKYIGTLQTQITKVHERLTLIEATEYKITWWFLAMVLSNFTAMAVAVYVLFKMSC